MKKITWIICLVTIVAMASLSSCKKDGPVTIDTIPPTLTITINGGGTSKTFYHTEDYSLGTFNLKSNTKYIITCALTDTGGVKMVQITLPKLLTSQSITGAPTDTVYNTTRDFSYRISKDETDPYKSFLLSGEFVSPDAANGSMSFTISSYGRDFRENRSTISIPTSVDNNPVGGYGWVAF